MRRLNKSYRVAVVEDHSLFRETIGMLVANMQDTEAKKGFEVVLEAENGKSFIAKLLEEVEPPKLVIMDLNMPVMDGFKTTQWLTEYNPEIRILILSMYDDWKSVATAVKMGACGYLTKNLNKEELEKAVLAVVRDGHYYSAFLTSKLIEAVQEGNFTGEDQIAHRHLLKELTKTERRVLQYLSSELSYSEIASMMSISPRTLEGYRESLFAKLGKKSRVGLATYAVSVGVDPDSIYVKEES